jgi:hypothetical protein
MVLSRRLLLCLLRLLAAEAGWLAGWLARPFLVLPAPPPPQQLRSVAVAALQAQRRLLLRRLLPRRLRC